MFLASSCTLLCRARKAAPMGERPPITMLCSQLEMHQAKLVVGLRIIGVKLHGIFELQDGCCVFPLGHIGQALLHVSGLLGLWIPLTTVQRQQHSKQQSAYPITLQPTTGRHIANSPWHPQWSKFTFFVCSWSNPSGIFGCTAVPLAQGATRQQRWSADQQYMKRSITPWSS